jgi:RND family efflux transporter MFP subunit
MPKKPFKQIFKYILFGITVCSIGPLMNILHAQKVLPPAAVSTAPPIPPPVHAPANPVFPATLEASQGIDTSAVPEYVILRPSDQVTFSSETNAMVAEINVNEGSAFHAGDVLLTLDCRVQDADLKKAQAQFDAADMANQSANKLKKYGAISSFELVQAKSQQEMAKAEVDKLKAIVEKCVIIAPFNGAVSALIVHTHESVKPGDPLLKIVNTENLTFQLQVPSAWLMWLHINSLFNVHINETNKTIPAKITKINPQIDSVSQTVKIEGEITIPDSSLLPGMSGQAQFPDNPLNKKLNSQK